MRAHAERSTGWSPRTGALPTCDRRRGWRRAPRGCHACRMGRRAVFYSNVSRAARISVAANVLYAVVRLQGRARASGHLGACEPRVEEGTLLGALVDHGPWSLNWPAGIALANYIALGVMLHAVALRVMWTSAEDRSPRGHLVLLSLVPAWWTSIAALLTSRVVSWTSGCPPLWTITTALL